MLEHLLQFLTSKNLVEFRNRFPDAYNFLVNLCMRNEKRALLAELSWVENDEKQTIRYTTTDPKRIAYIRQRLMELLHIDIGEE